MESGCHVPPGYFRRIASGSGFRWLSGRTRSGELLPRSQLARPELTPGQFFQIVEPITHETFARVRAATRQLVDRRRRPRRQPGRSWYSSSCRATRRPGSSEFGACYDVASLISKGPGRRQADRRVRTETAQRLRGVARGRLHRDRDGSSRRPWGRSRPSRAPFDPALRDPVRFLAIRKTTRARPSAGYARP